MTRVLSSIILVLLLQGSIAHEYRVQSSVVVNRRAELPIKPSLLRSPPSSVLSPLLQLRGGSDYYDRSNDSSYGSYDDRSSGREDRNRRYEDRSDGDLYDSSPRRDNTDDRYNERDDYDDRGSRRPSPSGNLPNIIKNGDRRIGLAFLGAGAVFTMLGVSLFFNKSLMRLGNLLFIGGVPLTIGPGRTAGYFFQPKKSRATACLALGIFLVFIGSPVFGIILEVFGLLNLFGNMFPFLFAILKNMPVVGTLFKGRGGSSPRRQSYDDNDRYDDDDDYGGGGGSDRYSDDRGYGDYDRGSGSDRYY